jgi:hypothetical protein
LRVDIDRLDSTESRLTSPLCVRDVPAVLGGCLDREENDLADGGRFVLTATSGLNSGNVDATSRLCIRRGNSK